MTDKELKNKLHSNPVTAFFVKIFYSFMKSAITEMHLKPKSKTSGVDEKLSTIEHLILKLENQIQENRHVITSLQEKFFWSQILVIILLVSIILQITL